LSFDKTDRTDKESWITDFGLEDLNWYHDFCLKIKKLFGKFPDTSVKFGLPEAEYFIKQTGAIINYHYSHRFYIKPELKSNFFSMFPTSWDWEVHAPLPELFKNDLEYTNRKYYYYAMFHELTHWTGFKNRCNRRNLYKDDKVMSYAAEEVIAVLGSIHFLKKYDLYDSDIEKRAFLYIDSYMHTIVNYLVDKDIIPRVSGWCLQQYYETPEFKDWMLKMETYAAISTAYLHSLQK